MNRDKLFGLVYGCALADCLGMQVEGYNKEYIAEYYVNGVVDLTNKDWRGIKANDWTDDTDQLILIMEVLTENKNEFDHISFAKKWRYEGFKELGDQYGAGLGQLTPKITADSDYETNPLGVSEKVYKELGSDSAPNGAVMRCGICAFANQPFLTSILQSKVSHFDRRCVWSSGIITKICHMLINDQVPSLKLIKESTSMIGDMFDPFMKALEGKIHSKNLNLTVMVVVIH